jgi:hypothetical protein
MSIKDVNCDSVVEIMSRVSVAKGAVTRVRELRPSESLVAFFVALPSKNSTTLHRDTKVTSPAVSL